MLVAGSLDQSLSRKSFELSDFDGDDGVALDESDEIFVKFSIAEVKQWQTKLQSVIFVCMKRGNRTD